MGSLSGLRRIQIAFLVIGLGFCAGPALADAATTPPAAASGTAAPDPTVEQQAWQAVITQQIEAFRKGDAVTAFSFAADLFQKSFPDAATFYLYIAGSGYEPIIKSQSHSFGAFSQVDAVTVMQEVKLVGPDQKLYDAVYRLGKETNGWRVEGVMMTQTPGMGV